jgi:hypothetical protein
MPIPIVNGVFPIWLSRHTRLLLKVSVIIGVIGTSLGIVGSGSDSDRGHSMIDDYADT